PAGPPARLRLAASTAISAASRACSIQVTASDRASACCSTFAQAWEFAAGGMLALAVPRRAGRRALPAALRAALGWLGLAAIVASALVFTAQSPFPGWIAVLPVAGTLACLHWGNADLHWDVARDRKSTRL